MKRSELLNKEYDLSEKIKSVIVNVPNFPKEGIQFKDITPLFADHLLLDELITYYADIVLTDLDVNKIVCIDSRGFIFGSLLAQKAGLPFVLARKSGKLPGKTSCIEYQLEYGSNALEIQVCDIKNEDSIMIVDDLLATGGTISAVAMLVEQLGGNVSCVWNLIELDFLQGRKNINASIENNDINFLSLIHY